MSSLKLALLPMWTIDSTSRSRSWVRSSMRWHRQRQPYRHWMHCVVRIYATCWPQHCSDHTAHPDLVSVRTIQVFKSTFKNVFNNPWVVSMPGISTFLVLAFFHPKPFFFTIWTCHFWSGHYFLFLLWNLHSILKKTAENNEVLSKMFHVCLAMNSVDFVPNIQFKWQTKLLPWFIR